MSATAVLPWDAQTPFPAVASLQAPQGLRQAVVHRADAAFGFLHDNAIVWHDGELIAAWYNCPKDEMEGSACIRARRSRDGGVTWSPPEVIVADTAGKGILYVPVTLCSHNGRLFAFISRMTGADLVLDCESYCWDARTKTWQRLNTITGPFISNTAPVPMADGNFVMGGRMSATAGTKPETPAVAISAGGDLAAPWRVVPLVSEPLAPFEPFPETALWVDGAHLTAFVRGGFVMTSADCGTSWSQPQRSNLPQEPSKLYAGILGTGQRYVIWNAVDAAAGRRRNLLALAVGEPGSEVLSAVWLLCHGTDAQHGVGPEWSYPCAIEQDGLLYVICTSEKRHSVLSILPIASLTAPHSPVPAALRGRARRPAAGRRHPAGSV